MSPIYGKEAKWLLLAEIIEHYKLQVNVSINCYMSIVFFQGMTHFYFYIFHIDEYSSAMLNDYVRTGEVEVTYLQERNDRELLHWQMVAFRVSLFF